MQGDFDTFGVAGKGFIDTVIDNFLGQMIGTTGICVHTRSLADRIQPDKDFNIFCVVVTHSLLLSVRSKPKIGK